MEKKRDAKRRKKTEEKRRKKSGESRRKSRSDGSRKEQQLAKSPDEMRQMMGMLQSLQKK